MELDKDGDPNLMRTGEMVMMAWFVGADEEKIAEATGLSMDFIRPRAERLRAQKLWIGDKYTTELRRSAPDSHHMIETIMHVLAAEGLIRRSRPEENVESKGYGYREDLEGPPDLRESHG